MPKIHKETTAVQKKMFLSSLSKSLGILTPALAERRIAYQTYSKWFKTDEKFRQECIDIERMQADYVENKLLQLIEDKNPTAILFFLKCRRPEKWNDRSGVNVNVITTEFQIGSGNNVGLIDNKEIIQIDEGQGY